MGIIIFGRTQVRSQIWRSINDFIIVFFITELCFLMYPYWVWFSPVISTLKMYEIKVPNSIYQLSYRLYNSTHKKMQTGLQSYKAICVLYVWQKIFPEQNRLIPIDGEPQTNVLQGVLLCLQIDTLQPGLKEDIGLSQMLASNMIERKEKNKICTICARAFGCISDLKRHGLTHTGEKRHQCNICGKAFSRRDHVLRHCNVVHTVK